MKSIKDYISLDERISTIDDYMLETSETEKNGRWVDFVDEDTGEIIKMWVEDPDPEEEARKVALAKEQSIKFNEIYAAEKELRAKLDPLDDELWDYKEQLKDLKREYRDLQIDHEDEVGQLYSQGKFEEGEKLAQEYGEKFNNLDKQIQVLKNKIKKLEPKVNKLQSQIWKLWE